MSAAAKQIRVFVSSTFRDMHAERDHLVTVVFPELRERVERLGLEFFDVDLRWGVPDKDVNGETANSWEYCRQWIDRVEPLFICILGQRYGWVPEAGDFKDEADRTRQASAPRSITDLEVRHAVLNDRRKRRSYFYLRSAEAPATASEFVDPPPLAGKLARLKSEVRSCGRPVRDYPCEWSGSGFTGMEEFGRRVLEDLWSGVLRDPRYVSREVWQQALGADPDTDSRYTDESYPVPSELAEKIVALAKPAPVLPMDAERQQMEAFAVSRLKWFQGRTDELRQLTEFVCSTEDNAPRLAVVAAVPGQGKSALLAKLWQSLHPVASPTTDNRSPITGGSAAFLITHFVGATERSASAHALVQRLLDELDESGIEWPAEQREEGQDPKRDFDSLCKRLSKRLGEYAGQRRVVLLIDALNQLSDGHDLLWLPQKFGSGVRVVVSCVEDAPRSSEFRVPSSRLRAESSGLRAASSGSGDGLTPEQRVLQALGNRQVGSLRIPLGPLTPEEVRIVIVDYFEEYCKELDAPHVNALCALPQASNPLYLLVALGELRTLGGNEMNRKVPALIVSLPQTHPDTVSLFKWVLQRLEVFGAAEVKYWCRYLALGRVGMASRELADLLRRKLGDAAASKALLIERGLRRYLQRRGGQLDLFHGQLRQAVMEKYGPDALRQAQGAPPEHRSGARSQAADNQSAIQEHHEMAEYFTACARGDDPQKTWETEAVRGFSECVYHFMQAGEFAEAGKLLGDFPFLLHKTRVGLLEGVFEDYELFRAAAPANDVRRLEIPAAFFREKAHILRRGNADWPAHKILLQLAVEHADDSPLTLGAEQCLAEGRCNWTWLRCVPRVPHAEKNPCLAVLEGHADEVDGALALADGRLLSWSKDKTLRLWDAQSGACLAVLEGHKGHVNGALVLGDGRLLSWGDLQDHNLLLWDGQSGACLAVLEEHTLGVDGALALAERLLSWGGMFTDTLRLWDAQSGACLAVLEGHTAHVSGALVLGDGRLLSWSLDNTLRLWDGQSGVCLAVLEGHTADVSGALVLGDGRLLSWSLDHTLRLWDGQSGGCLAVLEGHKGHVNGALALADGRLLSWGDWQDNTLRIWDGQSGACLAVLEGHTGNINGALALADGRLLSWSWDETLRLWNGRSGACLAVLKGHSRSVNGALALADGRLLSWSWDETLRLWNGQSGACLAVLKGHTDSARGALALADGRLLSWSDDKTLRLWDTPHDPSLAEIAVRSDFVEGVVTLALADGRLLSRSKYTLRLWDTESGACLAVLEGHTDSVKGALALADGRLLSWSDDKTLRLWNGHSGACLAVLEGHTAHVNGAMVLADRRLLSWSSSDDNTLRLWDGQSGMCLAVLEGHTWGVEGAIVLADGRLLSWSGDHTLRLWDAQSGACLAVLKGHTEPVAGVVALTGGRLLSWATGYQWEPGWDANLRLWDGRSGACLAVLMGHLGSVHGALELTDGRLLSWSFDNTLRLWDGQSGASLAVLEGHTSWVEGALALADGWLLSWSADHMLRLWDGRRATCLDVISEDQVARRHPDWLHARAKAENSRSIVGGFFGRSLHRSVYLHHRTNSSIFASWDGGSDAAARWLLPDGTLVVTQQNEQICILKLYHGNRPISIEELEAMHARSAGDRIQETGVRS